MRLPRLGTFLRIAPAEFERDFWYRSEHQRRLASFLDLWSLSFTSVNNIMVLRFVTKSPELLPYAGFLGFLKSWCIVFLGLGFLQIAWRLLAPLSYQRWRFCVLLFNRYGCQPGRFPKALERITLAPNTHGMQKVL
jgi:hypothetical protein